eukprot:scaffold88236_cov20-Cyclotella_meneghiniana.AAC.1
MVRARTLQFLLILTVSYCIFCIVEDTSNECTTADGSCDNPDFEDEQEDSSDDYEDDDDDAVYHTEEHDSSTC